MPLVTIKLLSGRTREQKRSLVKDVTEAIIKNANCPPGAVHIDLVEYNEENLANAGTLLCDGPKR